MKKYLIVGIASTIVLVGSLLLADQKGDKSRITNKFSELSTQDPFSSATQVGWNTLSSSASKFKKNYGEDTEVVTIGKIAKGIRHGYKQEPLTLEEKRAIAFNKEIQPFFKKLRDKTIHEADELRAAKKFHPAIAHLKQFTPWTSGKILRTYWLIVDENKKMGGTQEGSRRLVKNALNLADELEQEIRQLGLSVPKFFEQKKLLEELARELGVAVAAAEDKPDQEATTPVTSEGLFGKFKRVCEEGVCYIKRKAQDVYEEFKRNASVFLQKVLDKVSLPFNIELADLVNASKKIHTDIGTFKKDLKLLAAQAGEEGTTYNAAFKTIKAIDLFDKEVGALKDVHPPYSKVELTSAITGVPGALEKLWGGRSAAVREHFTKMLESYATIRDQLPNLDIKTLGARMQQVILELVAIMDDVTDIRRATGQFGDTFISPTMTQSFRGIRNDLIRIPARIGTLVKYRSLLVGGPFDNSTLAGKVGTQIIANIFQLGTMKQNVQTIHTKIAYIKMMVDTLKHEGEIIETTGKELKEKASVTAITARMKNSIKGASNILEVNKFGLQEMQTMITNLRTTLQNLILLTLTMLEQVAAVVEAAHIIGTTVDDMMGKNFVEPRVLQNLDGLAGDLQSIRNHSANIMTELNKLIMSK